MSSQTRWKLLAALIVASVIVGAVGWQQSASRLTPPTTIMITPTVTTVAATQTSVSASRTTVTHRETEWIRIDKVRPVSYYLSLLESNGTSPYGQLYWELRKLPDLTNATAVAKITYLALNATNPEVKEAFELMIKGGTPYPGDFAYTVPSYNTELQVLYWLACQNEFRKDDTLALAVAMVNGIWITIGDNQVRAAVFRDVNDLLSFFRETSEMQKVRGYHQLEDYPLEVKLCLAWTGGYSPFIQRHYGLMFHTNKQLQIAGYRWNTIPCGDLALARKIADDKGWIGKDWDNTMASIERHFFFDQSPFFDVVPTELPEGTVIIEGQSVVNHDLGNPGYTFRYFVENGKTFGDCGDQTNIVSVFAKSWGVSTNVMGTQKMITAGRFVSHFFNIYYDPLRSTWKAYRDQLNINLNSAPGERFYNHILKPPVNLPQYPKRWIEDDVPLGNSKHTQRKTLEEVKAMYSNGVSAQTMKQWLLYS